MSAATTRAVGVAMTAMRPSHMKPAARRWTTSSTMSSGWNGGPPASGAIRLANMRTNPTAEQGDRDVRSVRQQAGDRAIEVGGRAGLGVSGQARARWSICQEV